ncbi:hypothetical protein [Streptomyces tsukubensis]|uniref:Uncharacterized protein n=1 Tax=Streptomyces tsukubensis TaxID=83656 RepID=A0A1V4A6Z1_9ACTN|nr:hypothetical protein [Streptomyces tsukubensis]OON76726.1 hypothetical protein B1H18_20690 [Streptomyces tsukubensis]QFR93308.1 hypothetical protein GBW32_09660 [Streptomyces tsukubensis]
MSCITVPPEGLGATIAWCSRNLGFTAEQRFESPRHEFVFLAAGEVEIELLAGASNRGGVTADR